MDSKELKPCPFCGGDKLKIGRDNDAIYCLNVSCGGCLTVYYIESMEDYPHGTHDESGEIIRKSWNTRALSGPDTADMRDSFEKWATENGAWPHTIARSTIDPERYAHVQRSWEDWQAAWQAAYSAHPSVITDEEAVRALVTVRQFLCEVAHVQDVEAEWRDKAYHAVNTLEKSLNARPSVELPDKSPWSLAKHFHDAFERSAAETGWQAQASKTPFAELHTDYIRTMVKAVGEVLIPLLQAERALGFTEGSRSKSPNVDESAIRADERGKVVEELRVAVAKYMYSEGCSCCRGDDHEDNAAALASLLDVEKYEDGSGYDFEKYRALATAGKEVG